MYTEWTFPGSELYVPVICLTYPCHNFFLFRGILASNEIQPVNELQFDLCISLHSVHQAQHDLFAIGVPAASFAPLRRGRRCGDRRRQRPRRRRGQRRIAVTKFEVCWRWHCNFCRIAVAGAAAPAVARLRRGRLCRGQRRIAASPLSLGKIRNSVQNARREN